VAQVEGIQRLPHESFYCFKTLKTMTQSAASLTVT
jgi:hypothetical protein